MNAKAFRQLHGVQLLEVLKEPGQLTVGNVMTEEMMPCGITATTVFSHLETNEILQETAYILVKTASLL